MKASSRKNNVTSKRSAKDRITGGSSWAACHIAKGKGRAGKVAMKSDGYVKPMTSVFTAWSPRMKDALGI